MRQVPQHNTGDHCRHHPLHWLHIDVRSAVMMIDYLRRLLLARQLQGLMAPHIKLNKFFFENITSSKRINSAVRKSEVNSIMEMKSKAKYSWLTAAHLLLTFLELNPSQFFARFLACKHWYYLGRRWKFTKTPKSLSYLDLLMGTPVIVLICEWGIKLKDWA